MLQPDDIARDRIERGVNEVEIGGGFGFDGAWTAPSMNTWVTEAALNDTSRTRTETRSPLPRPGVGRRNQEAEENE